MKPLPVLAFQCPNTREKGPKETGPCRGMMACQLLDSEKGRFLVYCSKCGKFYLAVPKSGLYVLKKIDKSTIKFIPQPYTMESDK
jgi:hypothetical protein